MENKTVNILGTPYLIMYKKEEDDPRLSDADGYCDWTVHHIVVCDIKRDSECVEDLHGYMRKVLRHEIIHAFLYESGLGANFEHKQFGQEETMVDWLAFQHNKIHKAFVEAEAL